MADTPRTLPVIQPGTASVSAPASSWSRSQPRGLREAFELSTVIQTVSASRLLTSRTRPATRTKVFLRFW